MCSDVGGGISQFVPKPIEDIGLSCRFHEKYRENLTKILTYKVENSVESMVYHNVYI